MSNVIEMHPEAGAPGLVELAEIEMTMTNSANAYDASGHAHEVGEGDDASRLRVAVLGLLDTATGASMITTDYRTNYVRSANADTHTLGRIAQLLARAPRGQFIAETEAEAYERATVCRAILHEVQRIATETLGEVL